MWFIGRIHLLRGRRLSTVIPEHVRFGVRVRVRTPDGGEETFSVLGPWESDPARNILSYQAPFASCFVGKKVGDAVQVDLPNRTGEFCVSALEAIQPDLYPRSA